MNMGKKALILIGLGFSLVLPGCSLSTANQSPRDGRLNPSETSDEQREGIISLGETQNVKPTAAPANTPFNAATPQPESGISSEGTLILMQDIGSYIFIQNTDSGEIREIDGHWDFVKWHNRGCSFFVRDANGDIQLLDLDGKVLQSIFKYDELEKRGFEPFGYKVSLSPDNQWIWYWVASGRPYNERGPDTRLETQNIFAASLDLTADPYRISENGGAWLGEWSPDGSLIAYSDYDQNHVHQVYVSTREGKGRFQLTDFKEASQFDQEAAGISRIRWSPDHQKIAVTHYKNKNPQLSIYHLSGTEEPIHLENMRGLWWLDSNRLIGFNQAHNLEGIWIYNTSNRIKGKEILQSDYPYLQQISPYKTDEKIGFFSWNGSRNFYIYNPELDVLEHLAAVAGVLDMCEWSATPPDFPGEAACLEGAAVNLEENH